MDIYFHVKGIDDDGFSVIGAAVVPRVGEIVTYHYQPTDPLKWTAEARDANEKVADYRYEVCSVEHEFLFHDIGDMHHTIRVILERTSK